MNEKSGKLQMWEDDKLRLHEIWLMTGAAELSDPALISTVQQGSWVYHCKFLTYVAVSSDTVTEAYSCTGEMEVPLHIVMSLWYDDDDQAYNSTKVTVVSNGEFFPTIQLGKPRILINLLM